MPMKKPESESSGNTEVLIKYNDERVEVTFVLDGEQYGEIQAERGKSVIADRYSQVYEVTHVKAIDGYGPFMYDVLMEFVTRRGGRLTSDKTVTPSKDALNVWKHYLHCRQDVRSYLIYHPNLVMHDDARDYSFRKSDGVWLDKLEGYGQLVIEKMDDTDHSPLEFQFDVYDVDIADLEDDEYCDEFNKRLADGTRCWHDIGVDQKHEDYILDEINRMIGVDD